jgi:putative phage-type endonuclease
MSVIEAPQDRIIAPVRLGLSDSDLIERRKAIGASDAAAILGLSPYKTAYQVWLEKTGNLLPEGASSKAAEAGHMLEPAVLQYAANYLNQPLRTQVRVAYSGGPIVATLDAITQDGLPVEAKTAGVTGPLTGDWGERLTDQVPEHYLVQVLCQLICTGAERAWLFALLPGRGFQEFIIDRHEALCAGVATQLLDWWEEHIDGNVPPSIESTPMEVVKRIRRQQGRVVHVPSGNEWLLDTLERLKADRKDVEDRIEETQRLIIDSMAETVDGEVVFGDEAVFQDGRIATYYETHTKPYTAEIPAKSYRVLRIKKAKVAK